VAIEVVNRQRLAPIDRRRVARIAEATLAALGEVARPGSQPPHLSQKRLPEGVSLAVAFVRDPIIRKLNRDYRGKDAATDVLSFRGQQEEAHTLQGETDRYLGDIVISTDRAIKQAEHARHSFDREVSELVIHGVLHLCGYDHATDNGEMDLLELKLRRKLLVKRGA
jgi:probable rRNA maturation factor